MDSKAWDWEKENSDRWDRPSEESYYLLDRWRGKSFRRVLDLGCGRGRHALLFAGAGFEVDACDLSNYATDALKQTARERNIKLDVKTADMKALPYENERFDAVFAYHVISHTDSVGIKIILSEIMRVLKREGEFYLTFCSKNSWSFAKMGYPILDANSVVKTDDGPEKGVPHFYIDETDLKALFPDVRLFSTRQVQEIIVDGKDLHSWHFYVLGGK